MLPPSAGSPLPGRATSEDPRLRAGPICARAEAKRRLATNSLACTRHDAKGNFLLRTAGGVFDGALHRTAFDEMQDPPTVLSQMNRPSNRPIRRTCFPIVGRFHQVEKLPWNHQVVDHRVGSAQRVHSRARRDGGDRRRPLPRATPTRKQTRAVLIRVMNYFAAYLSPCWSVCFCLSGPQ